MFAVCTGLKAKQPDHHQLVRDACIWELGRVSMAISDFKLIKLNLAGSQNESLLVSFGNKHCTT